MLFILHNLWLRGLFTYLQSEPRTRTIGILKVVVVFKKGMDCYRMILYYPPRGTVTLDLPKSSCKKERDDLSRTVHSWKTQLNSRTVFSTAGGTFDHDVLPIGDKIVLFREGN